ncbi:MAG: hypothetical protein SOT71_09430 [Romboutsia timonensis]|uniref:hypothetical protein n=1 Tax=Romboutsia timonensis TaxID=1776391 RepID=UPI002A74D43C|nr:hypothetical protein [Romboutsia timonensis]MDY2882858.1 hypothetical protein [Romboutsia timonensis]
MIIKLELDNNDELLQKLDALCKKEFRSRPQQVLFIVNKYFEQLESESVEVPATKEVVIKKAIEEPKIVAPEDVEVGVEEIEIPLGVFDF